MLFQRRCLLKAQTSQCTRSMLTFQMQSPQCQVLAVVYQVRINSVFVLTFSLTAAIPGPVDLAVLGNHQEPLVDVDALAAQDPLPLPGMYHSFI
jgi:hypothetical protein